MNTLTIICFAIIDFTVIALSVKLIFKSFDVLQKSIVDHFFPDEILPSPLNDWAEKNDVRHKINILYAVGLALAGLNIGVYKFFIVG